MSEWNTAQSGDVNDTVLTRINGHFPLLMCIFKLLRFGCDRVLSITSEWNTARSGDVELYTVLTRINGHFSCLCAYLGLQLLRFLGYIMSEWNAASLVTCHSWNCIGLPEYIGGRFLCTCIVWVFFHL